MAIPEKPKRIQSYEAFPVQNLPYPLSELVAEGALALRCDPAYIALPGLAVLASLIGTTRSVRLKQGWEVPPILWPVIVGESGSLKTPALRVATDPLWRLEGRLRADQKKIMVEYLKSLDEWKDLKPDRRGERPLKPPERHFVTSDVTIERVVEMLEDSPTGMLFCAEELDSWFEDFTRYSGGSSRGRWLSFYDASAVAYDRKGSDKPDSKKSIFLRRAAMSITGCIPPGVLRRLLTQESREAGLAARLIMAAPPARAKEWTESVIPQEVLQEWDVTLERLSHLEAEPCSYDGRRPHVRELDFAGKGAFVDWYNTFAVEQNNATGDRKAVLSKLEGVCPRLALVISTTAAVSAGGDGKGVLDSEHVHDAISLTNWFARESLRIYTMLGEEEGARDRRQLLEMLRARGEPITARELQRRNEVRYPSAEAAESALNELAERGEGEWVSAAAGARGGRPTRCFRVAPPKTT